MICSYFKAYLRNLAKDKLNYLSAIFGLAIALSSFILVLAYGLYYYNYDKELNDYKYWYRLRVTEKTDKTIYKSSQFYSSFMYQIQKEILDIEEVLQIEENQLPIFYSYNKNVLNMNPATYATSNLLKHYKMHLIYGDPDSALSKPQAIIISQSLAKNIFGNINPVGKRISLKSIPFLTVGGVYEDLPPNLSYRSDVYTLMDSSPSDNPFNNTNHVRVKLADPKKKHLIEKNIESFLMKHRDSTHLRSHFTVYLDPINKIHFINGLKDSPKVIDLNNIHIAFITGLLMLALSLINFLSLHLLIWEKRNDELTFRKALGAESTDIFKQLFVEYSLSLMIAFGFALLIYYFAFDTYSHLVNLNLTTFNLMNHYLSAIYLLAFIALSLILAVSPILKLAESFNITQQTSYVKKETANNVFLIMQMIFSLSFISLALVCNSQMNFINSKDLGFKSKNLLQYEYLSSNLYKFCANSDIISSRLKAIKGVKHLGMSTNSIINDTEFKDESFKNIIYYFIDKSKHKQSNFKYFVYTKGFFENLDIQLLSGRFPHDGVLNEIVVNKTFADKYSNTHNVLGKKIYLDSQVPKELGYNKQYLITGVVADADFFPLYFEKSAICFFKINESVLYYQIYYDPSINKNLFKDIDSVFDSYSSDFCFRYKKYYVDKEIKNYYMENITNRNVINFFAVIIAFISLIGIYSITQIHIRKHLKDIALYKIHGAELKDIVKKYAKPYLYMFVIAVLFGLFVSYYLSKLFLNLFYLQIKTLPLLFTISLIFCACLFFLPLLLNIILAYRSKPAKYLSKE